MTWLKKEGSKRHTVVLRRFFVLFFFLITINVTKLNQNVYIFSVFFFPTSIVKLSRHRVIVAQKNEIKIL